MGERHCPGRTGYRCCLDVCSYLIQLGFLFVFGVACGEDGTEGVTFTQTDHESPSPTVPGEGLGAKGDKKLKSGAFSLSLCRTRATPAAHLGEGLTFNNYAERGPGSL